MEWNMLKESKKLFPHWLDKSDNSNLGKHLKILNNQQLDIRHNLKTIEWSRLLNKPIQIHKTQTEPFKWKVEFEANIPRLKQVNIYKNPTVVNNNIVNNIDTIDGYYYDGNFYEKHFTEIKNIEKDLLDDDNSFEEDEIKIQDNYAYLITPIENNYYFDLSSKKYYLYDNGEYYEVDDESVLKSSLIYSESFIDNYSHYFRHIYYDTNEKDIILYKYVTDDENNQKYKTVLDYNNIENNGKYELVESEDGNAFLYYNINDYEYYIKENDEFKKIDNVLYLGCNVTEIDESDEITYDYDYYYTNEYGAVVHIDGDYKYIFYDGGLRDNHGKDWVKNNYLQILYNNSTGTIVSDENNIIKSDDGTIDSHDDSIWTNSNDLTRSDDYSEIGSNEIINKYIPIEGDVIIELDVMTDMLDSSSLFTIRNKSVNLRGIAPKNCNLTQNTWGHVKIKIENNKLSVINGTLSNVDVGSYDSFSIRASANYHTYFKNIKVYKINNEYSANINTSINSIVEYNIKFIENDNDESKIVFKYLGVKIPLSDYINDTKNHNIKLNSIGNKLKLYIDDNDIEEYNVGNSRDCSFIVNFAKFGFRDFLITPITSDEDVGRYYVFSEHDENVSTSRIPLIETEDATPLISNDKYVLEAYTWNDYHFLKGFPEVDFIDYNNNNIIDTTEKTYDNLNINIEKINDNDYLVFRIHQFGIKLVEIFKDEKPIHVADFIVEKLGYSNRQINSNFAHIYNYNNNEVYYPYEKDTDTLEEINLDVDEYVWRIKLTDDDKIFDENGDWNFELKNKYDLQVTYYDSSHPYNSEYDKTLRKSYVYDDNVFYHDVSLDMIGNLFNVPRYVFRQPLLESYNEQVDFYSKTYPPYCNTLSEDDYHYQQRLIEYINRYNKTYFPELELWKYFHIDSRLVNRKVIIAEQNYSYMRTLLADEDKYINELGKNKLESFYLNDDYTSEEEGQILEKPKLKSIITPEDYLNSKDGILVDSNNNYIRDIYGTPVKTNYVYSTRINEETGLKEYIIEYENTSRTFQWYLPEYNDSYYQIKLTKLLKVVPNTRYQLRFCVKEYPFEDLQLRLIYKNDNGDVREVIETTPERKDYDEINENNELIYNDYNKEWGISCEYICTDFITSESAKNVEIILESQSDFKISDVTLQRVVINHFDSEYMKTTTDYNSCVYDLYADYTKIPSNIKYDDLNIFNTVLNRSLPLTKTGYFNFIVEESNGNSDIKLSGGVNLYIENLIDVESSSLNPKDYATVNQLNSDNEYEHIYRFRKYVKKGNYTIEFKPYYQKENNTISDFKIDITMLVFNENNTASEKTVTFDNFEDCLVNDGTGNYFSIPFKNESDNLIKIRIYRNKKFNFKNFKLIRESPLSMEEITK